MGDKTETDKFNCYHCGDPCRTSAIMLDDKAFCCRGCKTVFEILSENNLVEYYEIEQRPGLKKEEVIFSDYAFLDIPEIKRELLSFASGGVERITLSIPGIHCSSCIWLLENLHQINASVKKAEVNFLKKEVSIQYNAAGISLRKLAELLDSIGYKALFELKEKERARANKRKNLSYIYKLGISGFAFGNIMLLSFPEYFSEGMYEDADFGAFFGYLNLLFALPVFFYCSSSYFSSAWKGLKHGFMNIDVPISLGIVVLFVRSTYEVISQAGPGYFDSMTGLVFFLLVGRWFQNRTYQALSFERDYHSYFPLGVSRIKDGIKQNVLLKEIEVGDEILVNNGEIVPADAKLVKGEARIDYSFVTGEAEPLNVVMGEEIFAGGRQMGGQIHLRIEKAFSQSFLMQLWKQEDKEEFSGKELGKRIDRISHYFTAIILVIATLSGIYWWFEQPELAFHAFSSVLIIACPCALALTIPFTFGNGMRLFEKAGLYLRDARFIENLSSIDTIVFDKTGTITSQRSKAINYQGSELTNEMKLAIKSVVKNSNHPLSRMLYDHLSDVDEIEISHFEEIPGKGLKAVCEGKRLLIGSAEFTGAGKTVSGTAVCVNFEGQFVGAYIIGNLYRNGLKELVNNLKENYEIHVITGDGDSEKENLLEFFGEQSQLKFKMDPFDKRKYIAALKSQGKKVLMIGDGLNDAGAIKESTVGISISDDIYGFLPSCDAILEAGEFARLKGLLDFSKQMNKLVKTGFIISFIYNLAGLSFAVQGMLSPVVAAILMPLSSITVVAFATFSTNISARKNNIF